MSSSSRKCSASGADVRIEVRTSVAAWIFDRIRGSRVEVQACETDTGMVQLDSLRLDVEETARVRGWRSIATSIARVAAEASVPPATRRTARRRRRAAAGVRGGRSGRRSIGDRRQLHMGLDLRVLPRIRVARARASSTRLPRAYSSAAKALRLPISGGFDSVAAVTEDVPFIARRSTRDPAETRRALGIEPRPVLRAVVVWRLRRGAALRSHRGSRGSP